MREALKALEIMGLIDARRGDGTFVCSRAEFFSSPMLWSIMSGDVRRVEELIEARCAMESELASLAALRADSADLAKIEGLLKQQAENLDVWEAFLEADLAFHMAIAEAAHSGILLTAVQLIRNLMRQWIERTSRTPGIPARALKEHRQIFDAISAGDSAAARAAMEAHITGMGKIFAAPASQ